jgi:hypothetical protein
MITKVDIERIKRTIPIGLKEKFGKRADYDGFKAKADTIDINKIRENSR